MKRVTKGGSLLLAFLLMLSLTFTEVGAVYSYAAEGATSEEVTEEAATEEATETATIKKLVKNGAFKEGKYWYYYSKGKKLTGTKWIKENGVRTYYLKKGKLVTGWQDIKIKVKGKNKTCTFWFGGSTPKMARGYKVIGGKPYYFKYPASSEWVGQLLKDLPIKDNNGNIKYFTNKKGQCKTGWVAYKNKAYYMYKKATNGHQVGERAYNYKVNRNFTIGKAGYIGGQRGKACYYMIKKLDKYGWTLKGAYKASYKLKYANRPYRPKTAAEGAIYGGSKGKGNCYVMNCCFHVMADLMGYEVRQIKGKVNYYYPHSWLEIKQNDKWWVYDANFRNETGRNGFKIYYGKSGTWRYTSKSGYLKKY